MNLTEVMRVLLLWIYKHKTMDREIFLEKVYSKTRKFIHAIRVTLPALWVRPREWNRLSMAKYSNIHLSQIWARFLIIF